MEGQRRAVSSLESCRVAHDGRLLRLLALSRSTGRKQVRVAAVLVAACVTGDAQTKERPPDDPPLRWTARFLLSQATLAIWRASLVLHRHRAP